MLITISMNRNGRAPRWAESSRNQNISHRKRFIVFFMAFCESASNNRFDETKNGYCYHETTLKLIEGFVKRAASCIIEDDC